jgi:hypothetical protein
MEHQASRHTQKKIAGHDLSMHIFRDEEVSHVERHQDDKYSTTYYATLKDGSEIAASKDTYRKAIHPFNCEMTRHTELIIGLAHIESIQIAPDYFSSIFNRIEKLYQKQQLADRKR